MKISRHLMPLLLGATVLVTGGCGQLAYKTGAGGDALQADKQACRQAGGDPGSYDRCMHDKGWAMTDLSGSDETQPAATIIAPSAASTAAQNPSTPATIATAPVTPATPMPDPAAPVKVTAWVHFGGGGPDDDIAACVATLGPASQPDTAHHIVTRALLACMRGKGWHGV